MIFEKLKWPVLILHNIGKGPYKGIIGNKKIMKVCLSETHASGNREAFTYNIDGKPTDGTSTSKKRWTWNDEV